VEILEAVKWTRIDGTNLAICKVDEYGFILGANVKSSDELQGVSEAVNALSALAWMHPLIRIYMIVSGYTLIDVSTDKSTVVLKLRNSEKFVWEGEALTGIRHMAREVNKLKISKKLFVVSQ